MGPPLSAVPLFFSLPYISEGSRVEWVQDGLAGGMGTKVEEGEIWLSTLFVEEAVGTERGRGSCDSRKMGDL